ncbi:MAG: hypothetical protein E7211_21070 [Clostridium lundense]|nr:hypothetical protein [Clostridium lundense]
MKNSKNTTPPTNTSGVKNYALLHTELIVTDEKAKAIYHINSFYQKNAPEMGAVLDTIMLEKADRSA